MHSPTNLPDRKTVRLGRGVVVLCALAGAAPAVAHGFMTAPDVLAC
jgi:hypothetical protein